MGRVRIAWVVLVLAGCSDDAPVTATPDAGADAGRWGPEPPRIPWLAEGVPPITPPVLTPCPPGWREVHDSDVPTCDPYPETGPEVCAEGSAHFPGSPGCESVGNACPAGEWSDALPATGVLYVRAGAAGLGDGTRAAPFARIADAMSAASVGGVVALSRGLWDEVVRMRQGVTLQGACSAETVLTSSLPSEAAGVVNVTVSETALRDLRVEGAARPGLWVAGASAALNADGVVISRTESAGVAVVDGASLIGARFVVRDTQSQSRDRAYGDGLSVEAGGTARVTRGLFERNREAGAYVDGAGTSLRLEDVVVRDTRSQGSDLMFGRGLNVSAGASVEIVRVLLEGNRDVAIRGSGPTTSVRLEDVVVRDTQSAESDGRFGRGIDLQAGASADVTRALFERNRDVAIRGSGSATSVRLADVVVRDTQGQTDGRVGRGLSASGGTSVDVTRALLDRNRDVAVLADGAGTSVRLEDVAVRDTQAQESDGSGGRGLQVQNGARADVTRAALEHNRDGAIILLAAGTSARLEDIVLRDTQPRESSLSFGRGLAVQDGATAEVSRALLDRNLQVAIIVAGVGASVRLEDVVVTDTMVAACGAGCAQGTGGVGVGTYEHATVWLSRFVLRRAALCGVQIALDGELDLSDGEVRESAFGACVQVPGYRYSRLNASVVYLENGANLEATDFPVPELSGATAGL